MGCATKRRHKRCDGVVLICKVSVRKDKAASVLAEENSLVWAGEDDSLITHKDYLAYSALKVFIKEKEFYLQ